MILKYNICILLTFKKASVLREALSLEPFLNLIIFAFLPPYFPEEDPRHWAEEEGQDEAAVHLAIFQPSLIFFCPQRKSVSHTWAVWGHFS